MVKAIFFDIDGTLVSFETHRMPQSTINALKILREKGIKVFIATGRAFSVIDNLGDEEFEGYITVNGGCCLNKNRETIYKNTILSADKKALVEYLTGTKTFPCMAATGNKVIINYVDENVRQMLDLINFTEPEVCDFNKEIIEKEIFQLMAFVNKPEEGYLLENVLLNCDATRWSPLFTDIIAKGNSKQTGIDKILEYYKLDLKDTMAFGDGGNDIAMLKHVAVGIAMGNAADNVKQSADYVTNSVDDDGIWTALKKLSVI